MSKRNDADLSCFSWFSPVFGPAISYCRGFKQTYCIWQDSLEVNPSVLIGSFLVGILPYGPFPWKRSYAVYFFLLESWQIQTTKRKRLNTLIFERNYLKRLIFYRAYNKNEEHKYSRSELSNTKRRTQAWANVKTIL